MPKKRRRMRAALAGVSKKDFVSIAGILCRNGATSDLKHDLASYFGSQNPSFDRRRFLAAADRC